MLRDYLEKNQIKTLDQSITSEQIHLLKTTLREEIVHKQNEIHDLYQTKTDDIQQIDEQTKNLIDKCEDLENKRQHLVEQIDDYTKLEDHARHINSNYHQVHHLNQFINGLKQLINLQKQIHNCRQLCKKGLLNDAKTLYETISTTFDEDYLFPKDPTKVYQQHDPLYESFQKSFKQLTIELNQTHQTLWNDGIDRTIKNHLNFQLFFLDQLFQCRFIEDRGEKILIEKNIQTFATFCYQRFIEILMEKSMTIVIKEETNHVDISLEENDENDDNQIEEFDRKIKNLKEFFEILNQYVLSRTIHIQPSNQKTIESLCLVKVFSSVIVNDFTELIRERLLNLIPNDFEHLESFRSLLTTIVDFEEYLQKIEFYSSNTISNVLSSVVGNIDESIIKSRCRKYLTQCRDLLQSNAIVNNSFKTIELGDDEKLFQENNRLKSQYQEQISTNLLSPTISLDALDANMFRFPRTIIVAHVHEYIEFIRKILREADQLDTHAAHLCATARNLIELFQIIYGNLHNKKAEEIPYLTALHFNTYMYVAHECLILGEEFYHLKSKTADKQPITFVDYVPIFRNQAASLLQNQLDRQKEILKSFIREVGAFHNLTDDEENKVLLKRSIHKCVMLIENLSHNWKKVFSSHVYFRVIGHLCDYVSQLLIKETLALEDIPEEECQLMVDAYTQWSNFLQNLLIKDESSPGLNLIGEFAPNLTRFNELCLVLNSSMQTIVDRWFNGQGPLASQFTAIQIKQLIRALFQTSERRTAALAKIQ